MEDDNRSAPTPTSRRPAIVGVAVIGALLMAGFAGTAMWLGSAKVSPAHVEPAAPPIYTAAFKDSAGKRIVLGEWQHKLLIINFWATWCAPCKEEMPLLSALHAEYAARGVQIVGIAADSSLNVDNFAKNTAISYPLLPDEAGAIAFSRRLGNRLGLLPHTVVVAPGGQVVAVKLGPIIESDFRAVIEKHLPK